DSYQRCQRQEMIDADLPASARHNLELAKLLWLHARLARQSQSEKEPGSDPNPDPPPPKPEKGPPEQKLDEGADPNPGATPKQIQEKKSVLDKKQAEQKAIETKETMGGRGNIPPPADDVKLKPLSVEDALKNIDAAVERIRSE